jgi:hypothetical protein
MSTVNLIRVVLAGVLPRRAPDGVLPGLGNVHQDRTPSGRVHIRARCAKFRLARIPEFYGFTQKQFSFSAVQTVSTLNDASQILRPSHRVA